MQINQKSIKRLMILILMMSVCILALTPPKGTRSHLGRLEKTVISQTTSHCPHQAPTQTQCQNKQASFINVYETDFLSKQSLLCGLLLFVLILARFKQPFIEPIDKPPKFSY